MIAAAAMEAALELLTNLLLHRLAGTRLLRRHVLAALVPGLDNALGTLALCRGVSAFSVAGQIKTGSGPQQAPKSRLVTAGSVSWTPRARRV